MNRRELLGLAGRVLAALPFAHALQGDVPMGSPVLPAPTPERPVPLTATLNSFNLQAPEPDVWVFVNGYRVPGWRHTAEWTS